MTVVSVPTVLRVHTGGEKRVEATGSTLSALIDDLDSRYAGIRDRLVAGGALHRFVNVYVGEEDVRFTGGLGTAIAADDEVTILPAVAGG